MLHDPESLEAVPSAGFVPVFPLPSVVFFPRTILPLHVFEPRYRALVRDAAAGNRCFAVSLLKPGWEADYEGSPEFHETATVGRIEDLYPLEDGRFNLRLVGLKRVRLGAPVRAEPYRVVPYVVAQEIPVREDRPELAKAKVDLLAAHGCVLREMLDRTDGGIVVDERIPFETAVNGACANLPVEPWVRQSLLEIDDIGERHRRVAALLDEVLANLLRIRESRPGQGGDAGPN